MDTLYRYFVALFFGAAGAGALGAAPSHAEPVPIKVAQSSASFPSITPRLADALGLFEAHGLKPTFIVSESGAGALTALVSGSVEFATGGMDALLSLRAQGQDSVGVAVNIYRGQSGIVVLDKDTVQRLSTKSTDSNDARVRALDGLSIAAPSASSSMVGTLNMSTELVGGAKINFVYMSQSAMPAAMQTHSVDGYIASSPYPEQAVAAGYGAIWLSGPKREFPEAAITNASLVLFSSKEFNERHPEVLKSVRGVFDDFARLVTEQPDRVLEALRQILPDLSEEALHASFVQNSQNWTKPHLSLEDLRREIAMRKGTIENLDAIDPGTLVLAE
ncbi:ABC transporter substrate-binding protein [Sinorhizobium medicae]|uniref:ABC transporter substrate-binding protein n=1 Tax=Sinorhizobium medicae TaxID=110321 RepID=UPI0013E3A534|nr:ABC transporter substrate-binding protein [Sinorhizobium medicae]